MSTQGSETDISLALGVSRLPPGGMTLRFEANEGQRRSIADRFDLVEVERFVADLVAARWQGEGVGVEGVLRAQVVQTDVVTLDPMRQMLEEEVRLFFVPEHSRLARPTADDGVVDLDPGDDVSETFRGDRLDLGEALVQLFGLALDPYPRGTEIVFDEVREGEKEPSPFAVLGRLRAREG